MESEKLKFQFPKEGLVYDYFVDDGGIFNAVEEENADDEEKKKVKPVSRIEIKERHVSLQATQYSNIHSTFFLSRFNGRTG